MTAVKQLNEPWHLQSPRVTLLKLSTVDNHCVAPHLGGHVSESPVTDG